MSRGGGGGLVECGSICSPKGSVILFSFVLISYLGGCKRLMKHISRGGEGACLIRSVVLFSFVLNSYLGGCKRLMKPNSRGEGVVVVE